MLSVLTSLILSFSAWAATTDMNRFHSKVSEELVAELGKHISPRIEGRTLHINGAISTHIYDFLTLEQRRIEAEVDTIELNSFGGSIEWALEISRKISEYKKTTRISSGAICASACVYLFSAGVKREMDADTWLGFHGSRLGGGFFATYFGACFIDQEDGAQWAPGKQGCKEVLNRGYVAALEATNAGFTFMERMGVAPEFRTHFYALDDDPAWPASGNMLKKPDWILTREEALSYDLVHP